MGEADEQRPRAGREERAGLADGSDRPASEPGAADLGAEEGGAGRPVVAGESATAGGGRRLLAAVIALPWLVAYGVVGAWAVTKAARAMSDGVARVEVGYVHPVSPGSLLVVGALLLAAFATLLALALLLLWGSHRGVPWSAVAAVGWLLTAGTVWAALEGGLHPGLWPLYFFGVAYAAVLATIVAVRVARGPAGGTVVPP